VLIERVGIATRGAGPDMRGFVASRQGFGIGEQRLIAARPYTKSLSAKMGGASQQSRFSPQKPIGSMLARPVALVARGTPDKPYW
jgi:hypothetical protein